MRVSRTASTDCPVWVILLVKLGEETSKPKTEQAATITIHGVLGHAKKDDDRNGGKGVDIAVVQIPEVDTIGRDKNHCRPWIGDLSIMNEVVIKGLKRKCLQHVENSEGDH